MSRWLAAVLVAAALAWIGLGSAHAQQYNCASLAEGCDKGEAYAAAWAYAHTVEVPGTGSSARDACVLPAVGSNSNIAFRGGSVSKGTPCVPGGFAEGNLAASRYFFYGASCSSRPPLTGGAVNISASYTGLVGACNNGCTMMPVTGNGGFSIGLGENPSFYTYFPKDWMPTGDVCTKADTGEVTPDTGGGNDGDLCTQQGNLTQCMKPDGRHCAVASSGKEFCWQPGENGIKASGNDAATKSPQGKEAKPPPLPPNNGGDWEQKAQSTVVESKDGASNTSNVTSWESSYGSQGQGASGNGASGEGKGGSGSGSGLGGGSGNGDGDGDDDGAGGVGDGAGDFYTSNGKTVSDVFQAFKTRVSASPLIDAVQGFFTVSAGGACPTFTVPASEYWGAMTYDAHCSGDFLVALQAIGWVLMAVAALAAAYWALS